MNTYKVLWSRQDYGNIIIKANTEAEAIEKFQQGDYRNVELNVKGGEIVAETAELIDLPYY